MMPLGMEIGLGPGDFVLDGDPAPLPKKGAEPPQFSAHIYCGQMAGCIKMPLGMEVGLSPGDCVLDGNPPPFPRRGGAPNCRPTSIVYCSQTAAWINMKLSTEVGQAADSLRPTQHC